MNPITFNDKFVTAIGKHPRGLRDQLKGWQDAPLFDYETNWDKELALIEQPRSLEDMTRLQWPFAVFRLAMTERDVPDNERVDGTPTKDYVSHYVAHKTDEGCVGLLIWWRNPREKTRHAIMMHVFTYYDAAGTHRTSASLYVPAHGGWELSARMPEQAITTMAGSAIASFASFLIDCTLPTTHIAQVRPCKGNHKVSWQQARTHYTLIAHGHPANKPSVAQHARVAVSDDDIKRMAHDRRGHWRTYRHERFTYARGSRRWIKQVWCGPKEWMDGHGKQIYKILEPVAEGEVAA